VSAPASRLLRLLLSCLLLSHAPAARTDDTPEYRLKAAFLYNFARYTEWPPEVGATLTLCILGEDPFGAALDAMQGKPVGDRRLSIQRKKAAGAPLTCQIVYVAPSVTSDVARVIAILGNRPILTVADSPGALQQGVALNMNVTDGKVSFEANLRAARAAGLKLSSNLLKLATQVIQ
jgi:hypothetical protein